MSKHKERAEMRGVASTPKNFTCGKCGQVHPYNKGYNCINDLVDEEDDEEED